MTASAFAQQGLDDMQGMEMERQTASEEGQSMGQQKGQTIEMEIGRACPICAMMMKEKMAMRPWIIAAFSVFGSLVSLALLLLVILEVQWIRYWSKRLKRE